MRIYPVVNASQVVQYKEQVEGQKKEEVRKSRGVGSGENIEQKK